MFREFHIHSDVTKRKKAEQIVHESEAMLAEAQAIAKVGSWETDLKELNVIWSAQTCRIFEVPTKHARLTHLDFLEFVHPDDRAEVEMAFQISLGKESLNLIEHRIVTKDVSVKNVEERWQIVYNKEGNPVKAIGTIQDVTERRAAELERTKIIKDLIMRNQDLEQFSYIISHNLRSPVANIMGAINALDSSGLTVEDKDFLELGIKESVFKLDDVVKDLSHILQVKGELKEINEQVCFSELVENIKISMQNLLKKSDVRINYDFSAVDEFLTVKSYIYSVFFNLISNISSHLPVARSN